MGCRTCERPAEEVVLRPKVGLWLGHSSMRSGPYPLMKMIKVTVTLRARKSGHAVCTSDSHLFYRAETGCNEFES